MPDQDTSQLFETWMEEHVTEMKKMEVMENTFVGKPKNVVAIPSSIADDDNASDILRQLYSFQIQMDHILPLQLVDFSYVRVPSRCLAELSLPGIHSVMGPEPTDIQNCITLSDTNIKSPSPKTRRRNTLGGFLRTGYKFGTQYRLGSSAGEGQENEAAGGSAS